jgi:hypothetical protein
MANWVFESSTGKMFRPDGSLAGTGYAGGNCGKNPEGINNPKMQNVKLIGPLPEGFYTFGGLIACDPHLGLYVYPLMPDHDNIMFGRGGFYNHGDTKTPRCASEGCIVMSYAIRKEMHESPCQRLQVIACKR